MNTLTEIANKYHCDKGTKWYEKHGYTREYSKVIPSEGEYSLLEIGIWHGDSINMWREYNPQLKIDAIDIDPNVLQYIQSNQNINIHIGDQSNLNFLKSFTTNKSYDFIIDDGSHNYNDILISFLFLFPYIKIGGYYFIEDLHALQARRDDLYIPMREFLERNKCNIDLSNWYVDSMGKLMTIKK